MKEYQLCDVRKEISEKLKVKTSDDISYMSRGSYGSVVPISSLRGGAFPDKPLGVIVEGYRFNGQDGIASSQPFPDSLEESAVITRKEKPVCIALWYSLRRLLRRMCRSAGRILKGNN